LLAVHAQRVAATGGCRNRADFINIIAAVKAAINSHLRKFLANDPVSLVDTSGSKGALTSQNQPPRNVNPNVKTMDLCKAGVKEITVA